jgi:hypothetical protein
MRATRTGCGLPLIQARAHAPFRPHCSPRPAVPSLRHTHARTHVIRPRPAAPTVATLAAAGSHWLPLGHTGCRWATLAAAGSHWLPLGETGCRWATPYVSRGYCGAEGTFANTGLGIAPHQTKQEDGVCRRSMQTEHADGACRRSMPTEHADGACRRIRPTDHEYADGACRRSMPTEHADGLCRRGMSTGHAERGSCRRGMPRGGHTERS